MKDKQGREYIHAEFIEVSATEYDVMINDYELMEYPVYLSEAQPAESIPWERIMDSYKGEGKPTVRCNYALKAAVKQCNELAKQLQDAKAPKGEPVVLVQPETDHDRSGMSASVYGFLTGALIMGILWWFAPL